MTFFATTLVQLTLPLSMLALASPAAGQYSADLELFPVGGADNDEFGAAVGISSGVVAIGAPLDDPHGPSSGSAFLFDALTGDPLADLVPNDGAAGAQFGFSIAVEGDIVVVGAPFGGSNGTNSGAAYLFSSNTGTQLAKLLPDDGASGDEFGYAVAIDGGLVAVGAKRDDDNGIDSGSLYLFDASSGLQVGKLLPEDGVANGNFGESVGMDGGVVAVGAHGNGNGGIMFGAAYLFDVSDGSQLFKLAALQPAAWDFFGASVDIDDGIVVVGAETASPHGKNSGAAFLFDASTGTQTAKLDASNGSVFELFGSSVSIDGGTVAIGSKHDKDSGFDSGSVYLFDAHTGVEITQVLASDGAVHAELGAAVAIDDGVVAAGAPGDQNNGAASGSVYVFGPLVASTTPNLGAGGNPVVLSDGNVGPRLGQLWPATVDTASSGHAISACLAYSGSLAPGTLFIDLGEVLVDPFSPYLFSNAAAGTGLNDHAVFIPNKPNLIGFEFTMQAVMFDGGPAPVLGNALDVVIGL